MAKYSGDPRWIVTRFPGKCAKCGDTIKRYEKAFFYPNGKALYCERDDCGQDAARDFAACKADEDFYNS